MLKDQTLERLEVYFSLARQPQKVHKKTILIGDVPTTPDPNTSATVSQYKWERLRARS